MMEESIIIEIEPAHRHRAASLARNRSTDAVKERVYVSQTVALALREKLRRDWALETEDGRSAVVAFVELLDLCDFRIGGRVVEVRVMTVSPSSALYVPTMPLMVGVPADYYICASVDDGLNRAGVFGFAHRADLAEAELTANGLFAVLELDQLRPFGDLARSIADDPAPSPAQVEFYEEWRIRAERIVGCMGEVLRGENAFTPDEIARLVGVVRDNVLRIYGERLPETGLEPLFVRLFRRFGIEPPVPGVPGEAVVFANLTEDRRRFADREIRDRFFSEDLSVAERVSLYRELLADEPKRDEHLRLKRTLDRATGGKALAGRRRREQLVRRQERRAAVAGAEPEPPELRTSSGADAVPGLWTEIEVGETTAVSASDLNQGLLTGMNIFGYRKRLIDEYSKYVSSFIRIRDERTRARVDESLSSGVFWPEPLIQLNPSFASGGSIDELVAEGVLHPECGRIFRKDKEEHSDDPATGKSLRLHLHQAEAIRIARQGRNYVLTTGTGSGKSLSYIIPIVDHVLRRGSRRGIQAIIVYPMNALANSQENELGKFLERGYGPGPPPVAFARYTGQESRERRDEILNNPPDILLTNFVMLELIMTRAMESKLIAAAENLPFLVLDELHTYRGRQGADVALLVRRVRDRLATPHLQCIGTSATIAGEGTFAEQRAEVAEVASQLFGAEVAPEHVIMETLVRATPEIGENDSALVDRLRESLVVQTAPPGDYALFVAHPLASWIEGAFGVKSDGGGRLVRREPRSISGPDGAGPRLSKLTGVDGELCERTIERWLLAGCQEVRNPETGFAPFAFRLHQFISRGDAVYATIEGEADRFLTLYGQQFKPGSRDHILLPLVFCRECGQEYYCVRRGREAPQHDYIYTPRRLNDQLSDAESEAGFLYFSSEDPWPADEAGIIDKLPDDWCEQVNDVWRIRSQYRKESVPHRVNLAPHGVEAADGLPGAYIRAPFRFCLRCGVVYGNRQKDDFAKLASLASEGRSTATTILSMAAIRELRREPVEERARKLLSFTDNRQDASLQAGHFNDFVEIALLRSALFRAASDAGRDGISHEELTARVFKTLDLPLAVYARNPEARFQNLRETERALREVLGYRLYRDLQRGWRITAPNLEQCGLLDIEYQSLDEVCRAEDMWQGGPLELLEAAPEVRERVARALLDYMRRELAINVTYLEQNYQEQLRQLSLQRLIEPWALDPQERMEYSAILFPRGRRGQVNEAHVYLSPRGGFGQYLRRPGTLRQSGPRLTLDETEAIARHLLRVLAEAGILAVAGETAEEDDPGYQLLSAAMRWRAGDGSRVHHDPIRMPRLSAESGGPNSYFVDLYRKTAVDLLGLEAREHTAQVESRDRNEREDRFREGNLPVLYCSPTMELGVDIAELNVVNMRNVPPTPANYAQRSGRAGRGGQPALVFTYCTTGSPHDQYFFKRPGMMVAGKVAPPRLDLANEDLVRAHVQAIWLAETGQWLGRTLSDVLDLGVAGDPSPLPLLPSVEIQLSDEAARRRALERARRVLETFKEELRRSGWYTDAWLDEAIHQVLLRFEGSCRRWRDLFRATERQIKTQTEIANSHLRSTEDRRRAERLRREAIAQQTLLLDADTVSQSDFYSYRYFASEGFLPGYNFPRLPISAFLPGQRLDDREKSVSRPRFLAISEFGPRAIVYHEGARYVINRAILPADEESIASGRAKLCGSCGYLHPITQAGGPDVCERCGRMLTDVLDSLFRMQNVNTKRRDRISSDEEERVRLGYEIITTLRFTTRDGSPGVRTAEVVAGDRFILKLTYGQAATLRRINLGWSRRENKAQLGFVLDTERGYWGNNKNEVVADPEDPMSARVRRVIPYVEDTRNCLLIEPIGALSEDVMATLQAALENAVQLRYQLEDAELSAEPLPRANDRRLILLYESADGGAGVLRRLVEEPQAFAQVAVKAMELCHFDPATGADLRRSDPRREECEAACYDCLMSYYNQREHRLLDRHKIREILIQLAGAQTVTAPGPDSRRVHLSNLVTETDSELERRWLRRLDERGHNLPDAAQVYIESCSTRPDFLYREQLVAVYIDGPVHDFPDRQQRDRRQEECMFDLGYTVVRFGHDDDWDEILSRYPSVFGMPVIAPPFPTTGLVTPVSEAGSGFDPTYFDEKWHPILAALSALQAGIEIEPGGDVEGAGRVVGSYPVRLTKGGNVLCLVDAEDSIASELIDALASQGERAIIVEATEAAEATGEAVQKIGRTIDEEEVD